MAHGGSFELIFPGEGDLYRLAGFDGEQGDHGFHGEFVLAAKAAAHSGGDNPDFVHRHLQDLVHIGGDQERTLQGRHDQQFAGGQYLGIGGVRFDVRVFHHGGGHPLLKDNVGFLPALLDIAGADFEVRRQVGFAVDFDRFRLHRFQGIKQGGQGFVIHFDQPQGFLGASRDSAATAATASP